MKSPRIDLGVDKQLMYNPVSHGKYYCMFAKFYWNEEICLDDPAQGGGGGNV